jgi:DNA ligase 1
MQKYDTLYARTNTGAVQVWWMERDGAKYRSCYGQKDGAITEADWIIAEPKNVGKKNATTSEEQAEAEVKAKYKKQLKSEGYHKSEKDIDKQSYFQVMLAKNYGDYKDEIDWSKGVGVQIKYNGGRIVATKDGLFTRKGERYRCLSHIEEGLQPFFRKFPQAVLDGEGFNYDRREKLNEIMQLLRKTVHFTPEDLKKSKELIRFYLYDGFGFEEGDLWAHPTDCYLRRKQVIDWRFGLHYGKGVVAHVPTWVIHSEKELEELYQTFLADKQEGAILRILGEPYENKRSKNLLKYKPVDDAEYRVIAVNEGKIKGQCETVTCQRIDGKQFLDGTDTFEASFKGSHPEAKAFLKDHASVLNKVVTIYFNGFTGFGKPNYAQFDINNYDKGH